MIPYGAWIGDPETQNVTETNSLSHAYDSSDSFDINNSAGRQHETSTVLPWEHLKPHFYDLMGLMDSGGSAE